MTPLLERVAPTVGRAMLRTQNGPLRPVWALAYRGLVRAVAAYIARGAPQASVYVKGSLAHDRPVYGVSDVDVILVLSGHIASMRDRIVSRWDHLRHTTPTIDRLVDLWVTQSTDLAALRGTSFATYGLDDSPPGAAAFLGATAGRDPVGLLARPGLYGPMQGWRRLSGPERLPALPPPGERDRLVFAWLELQFRWWHTFQACADPSLHNLPALCPKLVADPARIWLWLVQGERATDREAALRRVLVLLPEEEPAIRAALAALASPTTHRPELLEVTFAGLVRFSRRIAERLGEETQSAGATEVGLIWGDRHELALAADAGQTLAGLAPAPLDLLPLVDWRARALVIPSISDEAFALIAGDPTDHAVVGAAAAAGATDVYPALRAGPLLILPTAEIWRRTILRSVQCPASDPVAFALADGRLTARFPEVRGFAIADSARRAVAELGAWLRLEPGREPVRPALWLGRQPNPSASSLATVALLFASARAALLAESLEAGDPRLLLTVAAVARALAEHAPGGHDRLVLEAADTYRACRRDGSEPPATSVSVLRNLVLRLPTYAVGSNDSPIAGKRGTGPPRQAGGLDSANGGT